MDELLDQIGEVDTLQVFTTDLNGRPITLQVNSNNAESLFKKGVGFDGSSVPGYATRKATSLWDTGFLPTNMYEALLEAERSDFLKEFLGDRLYTQYMSLKINEWEDYRTFVTPREHTMSLHI